MDGWRLVENHSQQERYNCQLNANYFYLVRYRTIPPARHPHGFELAKAFQSQAE
jgi:hypothetical protein